MSGLPFSRLIARFGRERWNEHVKLFANLMNGVSVASIVGAVVAPLISAAPVAPAILLFSMGMVLHLAAQFALRYFVGKE